MAYFPVGKYSWSGIFNDFNYSCQDKLYIDQFHYFLTGIEFLTDIFDISSLCLRFVGNITISILVVNWIRLMVLFFTPFYNASEEKSLKIHIKLIFLTEPFNAKQRGSTISANYCSYCDAVFLRRDNSFQEEKAVHNRP